MKYLSQEEVKRGEFGILLAFDRLMKVNGLSYSLIAGTLLGAVRHKGFIPWDDDIDVAMPRPDYNRLIALINGGYDTSPFVISGYETDGFPMPFLKMFDRRIKVEDRDTRKGLQLYLWIDIFPIDSLPEDEESSRRLERKAEVFRGLIKAGNFKFIQGGNSLFRRIAKRLLIPPVRLFRVNDWAERKLIELMQSFGSYESAKLVGSCIWSPIGMAESGPKEWFEITDEIEFERYRFPAIKGWDEWLTARYGNYMELPPESERVSHGVVAWRDTKYENSNKQEAKA